MTFYNKFENVKQKVYKNQNYQSFSHIIIKFYLFLLTKMVLFYAIKTKLLFPGISFFHTFSQLTQFEILTYLSSFIYKRHRLSLVNLILVKNKL